LVKNHRHTNPGSFALKALFGFLIFLFALNVQAQNTKGDQPTVTPSTPQKKKGKLLGNKQSGPRVKSARGQRARNVFPQDGPFVNNPSKKPKKEKASITRLPSAAPTAPSSGRDRAWTQGTVSGTRLRPRSVRGKVSNVYPQKGPFVHNPSPKPKKERASSVRLPSSTTTAKVPTGRDKPWSKGTNYGLRVTPRSAPPRNNNVFQQSGPLVRRAPEKSPRRNVFPQSGPFVHNPSRVAKVPGTNPKNQPLSKSRRLSVSAAVAKGRSLGIRGAGFKTITSQFITRGRKNVYWGKFSKKEVAITTDIAGRKLRTRNYHSPRVGLVGRDTLPFFRRSPAIRKRGPSQVSGGYQSATRSGKAWSGDIAGHRLRKSAVRANSERAGKFVWPRKLSITGKAERVGLARRKKPESATRTGRASLNPIPTKQPGLGGIGLINFSKSASPKKRLNWLGGSASGQIWNNRNKPLPKKDIGIGGYYAGKFQGRDKARRPLKGGGSVSRNAWNNKNQAISVNKAGIGTIRASRFKGRTKGVGGEDHSIIGLSFTGFTKASKPVKGGGGSISGKSWNNNRRPLAVRPGGIGTYQAGKFQGTAKVTRPEKGGGSVSGQVWNNRNKPLAVKPGGVGSYQAGKFQGTVKAKRPTKGGGSISGKSWNNDNNPIAVKTGGSGLAKAATFKGRTKFVKPEETAGKPAKYQGNIKGILPGPHISQIGLDYTGSDKQRTYIRNPKAAEAALKKREPGRAQAGIGNLQVNVKMNKYRDKSLHPDAKFAHSYRDNVKEERTIMMNIKLAWAKLFKKEETQPRGLKQKPGKPRYDPKEKGLWYE
jgi:hypothetical protein